MASDEQLRLVCEGREAWNRWRRTHSDVKVDFAGVDFTSDHYEHASFAGFEIGNSTSFEGAKFRDGISFNRAVFGDRAYFDRAIFKGTADFNGAEFTGWANFAGAKFQDDCDFSGVTFRGEARFGGAGFERRSKFISTAFTERAHFHDATFGDSTSFEHASFLNLAIFGGAKFVGEASFANTVFAGKVIFNDAIFSSSASFASGLPLGHSNRNLHGIDFSAVRFRGPVNFSDRDLVREAVFAGTFFSEPPDFRGIGHSENLDWTGVRFGFGGRLGTGRLVIRTPGWTMQSKIVTDLRRLRGIAKEIHAVDAERDLFILEREAERGVLWKEWLRGDWRTILYGWWRPFTSTFLMIFYIYLSNCGRSIWRPLIWLGASNWAFYHLYKFLYVAVIERPPFGWVKNALFDLTLASAIPFGSTARPSFQSAAKVLFYDSQSDLIQIPWQYQFASAGQGITNLVLLFLLGLALRNYFKFR